MRKPLELWHFVLSLLTLIITSGILIINQSNKIENHETRIIELEATMQQAKRDSEKQFDKVNERLDRVTDKLTEILVELQNKKNR